jgi:hypothetical protein
LERSFEARALLRCRRRPRHAGGGRFVAEGGEEAGRAEAHGIQQRRLAQHRADLRERNLELRPGAGAVREQPCHVPAMDAAPGDEQVVAAAPGNAT